MFHLVVETDDMNPDSQAPPVAADDLETVHFSAGNPHSADAVSGHLRLYRRRTAATTSSSDSAHPAPPSKTLCVLAVPAYMTAADFCNFVAPYTSHISTMRILKDSRATNRYMVLVTFHDADRAADFSRAYDGKRFSSMTEERCRVLSVADVQFVLPATTATTTAAPTPAVELPTCPVCLERLDSAASGVMTSLCNHAIHSSCLSKWGDNSCPVCRFCQEPAPESNACMACGTTESLWMCLICGHVGCGRYVEFHALAHFKETSHTFSMELETGRVWDYAGDNYVHRLIVNKSDGKLVELPPHRSQAAAEPAPVEPDPSAVDDKCFVEQVNDHDRQLMAVQYASKVDAVTKEFDHLLASQLESQRMYYEEKLEQSERGRVQQVAEVQSKLDDVVRENEKLRSSRTAAEKARKGAERKSAAFQETAERVAKDSDFIKSLNDNLIRNTSELKAKVAASEEQIRKLVEANQARAEEVRDLVLHLETLSSTLTPSRNELAGADLLGIVDNSPQSRRNRLRGKVR